MTDYTEPVELNPQRWCHITRQAEALGRGGFQLRDSLDAARFRRIKFICEEGK